MRMAKTMDREDSTNLVVFAIIRPVSHRGNAMKMNNTGSPFPENGAKK